MRATPVPLPPVSRTDRAVEAELEADPGLRRWHEKLDGAGELPCPHPPRRLWSWSARDDTAPSGRILCVACCDCGAVL